MTDKMTIPEIDLEISQIKEEIEMTESYDTRRMLKKDLQDLINERAAPAAVSGKSGESYLRYLKKMAKLAESCQK